MLYEGLLVFFHYAVTYIIFWFHDYICSSSEDGPDTPYTPGTPDTRNKPMFYMLRKDSERRQTLLEILEGDQETVSVQYLACIFQYG